MAEERAEWSSWCQVAVGSQKALVSYKSGSYGAKPAARLLYTSEQIQKRCFKMTGGDNEEKIKEEQCNFEEKDRRKHQLRSGMVGSRRASEDSRKP